MYYIDDYKKRAIKKIVPYLIEFPEFVKLVEVVSERYQSIEDVIWKILNNLKTEESRGIFLDANVKNEVLDVIYTDMADDAFTYGTTEPLKQGYGAGHYYSQASYVSGIRKNISEDKMVRAVLAKIIENNTNGLVEDVISALKLYYNAEKVNVYESYPLGVSIMINGNNLELSSSGNRQIIKKMLPKCVSLKNIFINNKNFDIFQYNQNSSYGIDRYPVKIGDAVDTYNPISHAINLNSANQEHIVVNGQNISNNTILCLMGKFSKLQNETLLSCSDETNDFNLGLLNNKIVAKYNNTEYTTNITPDLNKPYTLLVYNNNGVLKLWVIDYVLINGSNIDRDESLVVNTIKTLSPNLTIKNFITPESDVYLNCQVDNNTTSNYSDFDYYLFACGTLNNDELNTERYYVTCYGEKNILFNCFDNSNHLKINTLSDLKSNLTVLQSDYHYKTNHSYNKYMYLDGNSYIRYNVGLNSNSCTINKFDLNFDICTPNELKYGTIISNFIGDSNTNSIIYITENGVICLSIAQTDSAENNITYVSNDGIIQSNQYYKFNITYDNKTLNVYQNGVNIFSQKYDFEILNTPTSCYVGCDKTQSNLFNGFIRNMKLNIIGVYNTNTYNIDLDLPFTSTLQDINKSIDYINNGARFITAPQLIKNDTKTDLYNNLLISNR